MKKLGGVVAAIVLVLGVILTAKSLVKVPAGYVAVQYDANGGVKEQVLNQGWHLKSPTVKTTLYTVGLEQSYLTKSKKGDSPDNDSFSASSSETYASTKASDDSLGHIQIGYFDNGNNYGVKLADDGTAYVTVPASQNTDPRVV